MSSTLLSGSVWNRLSKLSESSSATLAAVPYFGSNATSLLRLDERSTLVVRFDMETISAGQVDPREIIKAIESGVAVHSCANLHAKIFVFGDVAVVGSSNVSKNSDQNLIEACIETTDRKVVSSAKKFIRSLIGDEIGLDYAKEMVKFYRPPFRIAGSRSSTKNSKRIPKHSDLWLVALVEKDWQDIDYEQNMKGRAVAEKAIVNPKVSKLEEFQWTGNLTRFKLGVRVIQSTKMSNGKIFVSPPSRVICVRKYTVNGKQRGIVYLEAPIKYRRRNIESVVKLLGDDTNSPVITYRTKQIRNSELIYKLGRVWS